MDEQLKQLAETLKKIGIAASISEAIEKAKSIMNIKPQKTDSFPINKEVNQNQETPFNANIDANIKDENSTLNELMNQVNVTPEQVEAQRQEKIEDIKEEISEIKRDISQVGNNPEKTDRLKEEIAKIKDDVDKIEEIKTEEEPQENNSQSDNDIFKEEKKIDLAKVFSNKK